MANAPVRNPELKYSVGTTSPALTLPGVSDGGNTITAGSFVNIVTTTGVTTLVKYVADDIILYGFCPDKNHATTDEAYTAPYGAIHNVRALRGARFLMNLTDGSGTVGSGSTRQQDVAVGTLYSARYCASPYTGVLAVDASDSGTATKHIFKVESLWPEDAVGDLNGRVIVSILETAIQ
jgi:hypothetical protein